MDEPKHESVMTALTPVAPLSIAPVLVEVPIVKQIAPWTPRTLPANWRQLRDRWGAFHIVRVVAGIAGLAFLVAGAIF